MASTMLVWPSPAGQHLGIGFPLVGKVPAVAPVALGQRLPELAQRRFAPAAQRPAHDAPPGAFNRKPQPDLAFFAAHEAPQLIEFQDFPFLALRLARPQPGQGRRVRGRFFLAVWPPSSAPRPSRGQCCAANYVPPAGPRPARTARLWLRRPTRTVPGSHRPCTGNGRDRRCGHCGEFPRCRISRNNELSQPQTGYANHFKLDHRQISRAPTRFRQ